MSTTTEGATGTKRRRVDGVTTNGRTTERSTTATAPPTEPHDDDVLSSLLGTRLDLCIVGDAQFPRYYQAEREELRPLFQFQAHGPSQIPKDYDR